MNRQGFCEFEGFRLDTAARELWQAGERVPMSPKEAEILCILVERPGRLVTKEELVGTVWSDSFVEESNLSRQIYMLRKRLSSLGAPRNLIENVPRRGYRFNGQVAAEPAAAIIERHTFSQTLIEEIQTSDPAPNGAVTAMPLRRARVYLTTAVACCFAILAGVAFAAWNMKDSQPPSTLAVLPFNVVGAGSDAHEGTALADLVITRLSSIRGLTVRPTSTVINFEPSGSSLEAGRKLGVESVIEGTVLEDKGGRRVTVRMLSVSSGDVIWSGEFDVADSSLFSVHDEIAGRLTDAVFGAGKLSRSAGISNRASATDDAFRHYAEARYHWYKRNAEGIARAMFLYRKAIEADPEFVLAKVGLAETLMMGYEYSMAEELLSQAEAVEPDLSEIYSARGFIEFFHKHNGIAAETYLKQAVELNANNGSAHQWYALLLAVQGRFDEAKEKMGRSIEIDPFSANFLADMAQIHYFAGELEAAENFARRSLELQPNFAMAYAVLSDVNLAKGDVDRWVEHFAMRQATVAASNPEKIGHIAAIRRREMSEQFARGGIHEIENAILKESEIDNNPNRFIIRAQIFVRRGRNDLAVAALNNALEAKAFLMPFVKADPAFGRIRHDPGFQNVVNRIGL